MKNIILSLIFISLSSRASLASLTPLEVSKNMMDLAFAVISFSQDDSIRAVTISKTGVTLDYYKKGICVSQYVPMSFNGQGQPVVKEVMFPPPTNCIR